ncbi:MAG: DUF4136 domain-containing protein [Bacteroidetes bacterium]|nr:DUF4136 domain-containing protein [Bacteroidota bacterium]MBL7103124.1 DUF4136 domain-containing protein [Bacteroidales bacterium]
MNKLLFKIGILAGIAVALTSCYPGGAEYTEDLDLVVTDYNPDYNFKVIQTYYMADSIYHIVDEGVTPDRTYDAYIISELERNFDALGYERLDTNDIGSPEPDVAVVVTAIKVTYYNIYSYPWYPGWGWGYPDYGWGYPWYGGSYVTSYETGTVLWDMFDPDNVDKDNKIIYVEWMGAINGLLGTSKQNTKDRITRGINQAFEQSPYLRSE